MAQAVGFVFVFLFYFAALIFGMQLASSVIEEKQSRIVEIIAAAIPLRHLLAGKVLGNTALAMIQLLIYLAVGLVGLSFTPYKSFVPALSGPTAWFIGFFFAGFVALACLWAVAGSLASRTEDLQATSTPLTMLMLVMFFGGVSLDGRAQVIASFVPPVSAVVMPKRILAGGVEWWEPLLALGLGQPPPGVGRRRVAVGWAAVQNRSIRDDVPVTTAQNRSPRPSSPVRRKIQNGTRRTPASTAVTAYGGKPRLAETKSSPAVNHGRPSARACHRSREAFAFGFCRWRCTQGARSTCMPPQYQRILPSIWPIVAPMIRPHMAPGDWLTATARMASMLMSGSRAEPIEAPSTLQNNISRVLRAPATRSAPTGAGRRT